jgi:MFS family permease
MELIFLIARFFQYLFVAPIWWLASGLAAYVYPFEGDKKHDALALVIATLLSAAIIGLLVYWL